MIPSERGGKRVVMLPDEADCMNILRDEGADERIIRHVRKVRDLAVAIGRAAGANLRLVEAGALLHDIGARRPTALTTPTLVPRYCAGGT